MENMGEIAYVNVLAKQKEVREMTEAYVKQQMLKYDVLDFDENIPKIDVNGLPNNLVRLRWNDEDILTLTLRSKVVGEYTMPISSLGNETLRELAETMSMLTISMEAGE